MIFKNIDFHNVDHLEPNGDAYHMIRIPDELRKVNDRVSLLGTGIELRFKMKSDKARIILRSANAYEAPVAEIVFGSLPAGWQHSSRVIHSHDTVITIEKPDMEKLYSVHREHGLAFNPDVVRILLPYCVVDFVDVIGDVEPPSKADYPSKTGLFYGSSITHGSLSIDPLHTYVYQLSDRLGTDYINLGYAGSAFVEKEMAEYIVSRKDWDFAFLELGINMANNFEADVFEERCKIFLDIISADKRPVLCTSIYTCLDETPEKLNAFREIVRKHCNGRIIFKDGLELMTTTKGLSADFVHPNVMGVYEITNNLTEFFKENLNF